MQSYSHIAFLAEAQSHKQTILVYDNTGRLEVTLSESGTSHNVNGIATT